MNLIKDNPVEAPSVKPNVSTVILISFIGVILSLVIGLAVYKFTSGYFEKSTMVRHSSGAKRNKDIMLPDGSKVWMNANSDIRYPKSFAADKREVIFEGEGFFAVVENEEKPFIIHTSESRIEVVGTTFNLRAFTDEAELIVNIVSGEVILFDKESDENAIQLERGEQGIFNQQSRIMSRLVTKDTNYLSWQTGKFFFRNTPLGEVIKKLIFYYKRQIVFEDENLENCKVSLDIDNQSLEEVMNQIKKILGINYETVPGKVILRGPGC